MISIAFALLLLGATPSWSEGDFSIELRRGTATDALTLLKEQGFHDVKNLKREGTLFEATATHDNTVMRVLVDPFTGIVIPIDWSPN